MNCCDRLLILFVLFAFIQFQLRWDRDAEVVAKPWQVHAKGHTNGIFEQTGTYIEFTRAAISYGTPSIKVTPDSIVSKDRHEIGILVHANVTGPPMSFHRVVLEINGVEVGDTTQFVSPIGYSSSTMTHVLIHMPSAPIKLKYYFDDVWETKGVSSANVHVTIRSGIPNLWDVAWSDVYI